MDSLDYLPTRPLDTLPRTEGFRFVGVGLKSETMQCQVWHGHAVRQDTGELVELKGWRQTGERT